jgi:hypothetical protein
MKKYLKDMKHVIGFTAFLAVLLFGMTFVSTGNAAAVPAGNNAAVGVAAVVPPRVPPEMVANDKSDFRPAFNRPFFNRPAFNPFFARPAFNPFFARPAFNPFFVRPFFNPFFDVDVNEFGAFGEDFD